MIRTVTKTLGVAMALLISAGCTMAQVQESAPVQAAASEPQAPELKISVSQRLLQARLDSLRKGDQSGNDFANAVQVARDIEANKLDDQAYFAYYSVPAMSPIMRLSDTYPTDGAFGGVVGTVLAQDQYETTSFVVYPFTSVKNFTLKLTELKNENGDVLPAENVDLKVVKLWYQNGNAWLSYFADPGLKLVPELLLHDENLIRVDTQNPANYARITNGKSSKEVWISAPQKLNIGFDPYQPGFADADTLQPVTLDEGNFKQFVMTVRSTPQTKPGLYQGSIDVTATGQRFAVKMPVVVRVLPFVLPSPKTNFDINKDMVVGLMGAWPSLEWDSKAILPILKNLRAHNIIHNGPGVGLATQPEQAQQQVRLMKEAGFDEKVIMGGTLPWVGKHDGTPLTFDEQMVIEKSAKEWKAFYQKHFGDALVTLTTGDEASAAWVTKTRATWRTLKRHGLLSDIAGHFRNYFSTAGYMLDMRPQAGSSGDAQIPNKWNQIGNGYTSFYAGQHNGSENPTFVRRQHGLESYLSNFNMINNYMFAYGPWNDRAWELYKPMVLAYPISNGLVDTLEWEGFRTGVDDIRYATKLRQEAAKAVASGELDRVYEGRKVYQWFAMMDGKTADLEAVRMEMIEKIMHLMKLNQSGE